MTRSSTAFRRIAVVSATGVLTALASVAAAGAASAATVPQAAAGHVTMVHEGYPQPCPCDEVIVHDRDNRDNRDDHEGLLTALLEGLL